MKKTNLYPVPEQADSNQIQEHRVIYNEYCKGRSLSEIAHRHGVSVKTVAGILRRFQRDQISEQRESLESRSSNEGGTRTDASPRRQRGVKHKLLMSAEEKAESTLEQMLLEAGLLSEIPHPTTHFMPYRERKPVRVKGKPVSETIIGERR